MERIHVVVAGRVQGVNFRATAVARAKQLGVTGWITNRSNGTVEVIAEGDRDDLTNLLSFLRAGPPSAQVSKIDAQWRTASNNFKSFDIR